MQDSGNKLVSLRAKRLNKSKKILVLQNADCENLGTFESAIKNKGIGYQYKHLYNFEKVPFDLKGYSGLIILGGPMNVYETKKYPFLVDEERIINEAIKKDIPTLGICLGAQLIAKAAGAKVFAGKKKEIGWYPIVLTESGMNDSLFAGFEKEITVFQWHGDTFDLPLYAKRLAGSELFPNQAFRIGKKIVGLQFHLEVTGKAIYNWMEEYKEELDDLEDYIDSNKIKKDTTEKIENLKKEAEKFYSNFLKLMD